jgi:hypothetical protein
MRSTRTLFGLGSLASLALAAPAIGGQFDLSLLVNEQSAIGVDTGLTYEFSSHIVAGLGGTYATISFADGDPFIMLHSSGSTSIVTAPDAGYSELMHLAPSPILLNINDPSENLKVVNGQNFNVTQYQVTASGTVAYKYRAGGTVQSFSTSGSVNNTVTEDVDNGLHDFNLPVAEFQRRQAIASDNTVVFFAREGDLPGTPSIYRLSAAGVATAIPNIPTTTDTRVIGASPDAVLYASKPNATTTTLSLKIGTGIETPVVLASYTTDGSRALAVNAVMTQANRIAFFNPGEAVGEASVGYFDASIDPDEALPVAEEGQDIENETYRIRQISINSLLRTNPMVNDKGTVVFDAIISPLADLNAEVHAILAWDAEAQQTKIVVKADQNTDNSNTYAYSDEFAGEKITALDFDVVTDQAGDVLKDALSDDNYLAFTIMYGDHTGVAMVQLPEPGVSGVLLIGTGAMMRRRRARFAISK